MTERWQQELRKLSNVAPPAGLWDRVALGPQPAVRRFPASRRLFAAVAAAVAVAVVVITLTVAGPLAHRQATAPGSAGPAASLSAAERRVHCPAPDRATITSQTRHGQPLPAGFAAQAAIRCIYALKPVPGQGTWQFELKQVARNGLTRLTAALRLASAKSTNGPCVTALVAVPPFVLVGRDGRVVSPQLPTGECGQPLPQVLTALNSLHWQTVSAQRGAQLESQAEVSAAARTGCSDGWKDMIGVDGDLGRGLQPSPGGRLFAVRPGWIKVCVYALRSGPDDTYLTGGGHIGGAEETALLGGLSAGRDAGGCQDSAPRSFAVLLPAGHSSGPAYVELDGCRRVLRPDDQVGQASAAAVAMLRSAGTG